MSTNSFNNLVDLAAERLGGKTLSCTDDFFCRERKFIETRKRDLYYRQVYRPGKWMDGWESRRKRVPGHDWCVVQLATSGRIHEVDIDTNHFLGNHPPFASLEATNIIDTAGVDSDSVQWIEILPKMPLQPGSQNIFEIEDRSIYTHLRLHIYPDGGVARLKVYGEVFKDWTKIPAGELTDLAAATNGARSVLCNDMFFPTWKI